MPLDTTTPGEPFSPGIERLQGSPSVLGWNDSMRVIQSWDGTTPGESCCAGLEPLQERPSALG